MSATDVSAPLARIAAVIGGVTDIGVVHDRDLLSRSDVVDLLHSDISGNRTLRGWLVRGPALPESRRAEQREAGYVRRRWVYEIRGFAGRSDTSQATLRDLAVAVSDALDADFDLAGTCHATEPCRWRGQVRDRLLAGGTAVSEVVLEKAVITLSTPV